MAAGRVLIVEDDANIRKLVEIVVRRHAEHVDSTDDGKVAMDFLNATAYDLVILDIMVPRANGLEIASYVATFPKPPKIIVLSAITRYFTDRFPPGTVMLQKPFDLDRLDDAIKAFL